MAPCRLCKDTGKQRVRLGGFTDGKDVDRPCMCARPLAPEEALDGLAFRAMTLDQLVERIVTDFAYPTGVELPRHMRPEWPTSERVMLYIGRLVAAYGSKLGGLSRKKLAARVMRRIEAHQRKQAKADWAAYYGSA